MKRLVYLNGRLLPESKASISVFDRGFNYGDGVFETLTAKDGSPLFLKEHLMRLKSGVKALGIPQAGIKGLLGDIENGAIGELIKKNGLKNSSANIKIIVTRGVDAGGHTPKKGARPTVIITAKPVDENAVTRRRKRGIKAVTISGFMPSFPGIKSLNFLPNIIGKDRALSSGADEGIFTDGSGRITEGTSANIFTVIRGVLITPRLGKTLSEGPLPGVVRGAVIRLAKKEGIKVKEAEIYKNGLYRCDEAFLTNSVSGVTPLIKIDNKLIHNGKPGPVTRLLQGLVMEEMR
ncbi:MAG: aminotransferase class IV [Deltaproteobacteria bacterium]|nr:aminotransferase class IV [Deltaproteobacteria bacterium]